MARELSYFEYHGNRYAIKDAALADSLAVKIDNYIEEHKDQLNSAISSAALSNKADKSVTNRLLTRVAGNETDIATLKNSVSAAVDGANALRVFMDNLEEITFDVDDNGNVYATGDVPHSTGVGSVNTKTGDVLLTASDVKAYSQNDGANLAATVNGMITDKTLTFNSSWHSCRGELLKETDKKMLFIELPCFSGFEYTGLTFNSFEIGSIRMNGNKYYENVTVGATSEDDVYFYEKHHCPFGVTIQICNKKGWTSLPEDGGYASVSFTASGSVIRKGVIE